MEIGTLLKSYRHSLSLTQSEMAGNIMSPSHYAKIEKGLHRINAEDLFALLDHAGIDKGKFIQELEQTPSTNAYNTIKLTIDQTALAGDTSMLLDLRQKISLDNNLFDNHKAILRTFINIHLNTLNPQQYQVSEDDQMVIKDILLKVEHWKTDTLSLYASVVSLYDIETNSLFINAIMDENPYTLEENKIILEIILKHINLCIQNDFDDLAYYYLQKANTFKITKDNFFQHLLHKFYELLLDYRKLPTPKIEKKINEIIQIYHLVGIDAFGELVDSFFKKYRNKK